MNNETLILYRLEQLEILVRDHTKQDTENFETMNETQVNIRLDIQTLKTQAGLWGAAAGALAAAIVAAGVSYLLQHLSTVALAG